MTAAVWMSGNIITSIACLLACLLALACSVACLLAHACSVAQDRFVESDDSDSDADLTGNRLQVASRMSSPIDPFVIYFVCMVNADSTHRLFPQFPCFDTSSASVAIVAFVACLLLLACSRSVRRRENFQLDRSLGRLSTHPNVRPFDPFALPNQSKHNISSQHTDVDSKRKK